MIVTPKSVSFADQLAGTSSASSDISVGNFGDANLAVTISITGDFSQTNTCTAPIPGGQKCDLSVVFKPTASGNRTGTLTISASGQTTQVIQLTGNGTAPADTFTPTSPATLTTTGTSPVSFAVNVTTQANSALFRPAPESLRRPPISPVVPAVSLVTVAWLAFLALLLGETGFSRRPVHVRVKSACFLGVASAAIFLAACGGGATTTPPNVGTQKGTYTLVLTAKSGTLTHTMNLTLNVN